MEVSLLAFAGVSLIVVLTPGPTVLLAMSNGARYGPLAAGIGIVGAALSDAVLIAAAALGLGALLMASAIWFAVLKWIGAAYLVWVGVRMLRQARTGLALDGPAREVQMGHRAALIRRSFLVAVSNPKGYLFFAALLPQFVIPAEPLVQQYLTLAAIFVGIDVAVMAVYAGLGARVTRFFEREGAIWIDRCGGAILIALGLVLATVRRSPA